MPNSHRTKPKLLARRRKLKRIYILILIKVFATWRNNITILRGKISACWALSAPNLNFWQEGACLNKYTFTIQSNIFATRTNISTILKGKISACRALTAPNLARRRTFSEVLGRSLSGALLSTTDICKKTTLCTFDNTKFKSDLD